MIANITRDARGRWGYSIIEHRAFSTETIETDEGYLTREDAFKAARVAMRHWARRHAAAEAAVVDA